MVYTKPQQKKKEWEGEEESEIRSSLLILDLKDGKLQDLGRVKEDKTFHKLHVLGVNDDSWTCVIFLLRSRGSHLHVTVNVNVT